MDIITHSVDFEVLNSGARVNHFALSFYEIAESAYDHFLKLKESPIPQTSKDGDPTDYFIYKDKERIFIPDNSVLGNGMRSRNLQFSCDTSRR